MRRGEPAESLHFELNRADFEANLRRGDITLHGVQACLPVLGLS